MSRAAITCPRIPVLPVPNCFSPSGLSVQSLVEATNDDDPRIREYAVWALARSAPENKATIAAIIMATKDKNSSVQNAAIHQLPSDSEIGVPALIEVLRKDGSNRTQAAMKLATIGPAARSAAPALVAAVRVGSKTVRQNAVLALGKIKPDAKLVVPVLVEASRDKDKSTSAYAIRALGELGADASDAVPALIEALDEVHIEYRHLVAKALGKIGPKAKQAIPALSAAAQDDDREFRRAAAAALKKISP